MARRQVGSTRRVSDGASFPFAGALHSKSRSCPCGGLPSHWLCLQCSGPWIFKSIKEVSKVTGDYSSTTEIQRTLPVLKKAYGDRR